MSGRNGSNDTLLRQWEMLKLVPTSSQGISTAELVSKLDGLGYTVTVRTIQRDLDKLSTHFPLMCDDLANPPVWFWTPKASLDIPNISIADALSIKMMEDYLTPLLPSAILEALRGRFDQAEKRLEALDDNPLTRWTDKIRTVIPGQPLKSPTIALGVLEAVQTALINERQLKAFYIGRTDNPAKEFLLHPLALVQRGPVSYLVATAFSYEDVRLYALHRFESAEELPDEADALKDFDIDAYIKGGALSFGSGEILPLRLRVKKDLKMTLAEAPLADDMEITPDGEDFIVTATVNDTWQLKWWIQSQVSQAEVLEPLSLRETIRENFREALAAYE